MTWLFELPVAMAMSPRRDLRVAIVVVVASLLTHPGVWWISTHLPADRWWAGIFVVEAVVAIVEGLFVGALAGLRAKDGLVVGVAMNGLSFAAGLCL